MEDKKKEQLLRDHLLSFGIHLKMSSLVRVSHDALRKDLNQNTGQKNKELTMGMLNVSKKCEGEVRAAFFSVA